MEEDLKTAIEILKKGGVILYPTDTIWGIGCDATNSEAVKRVYEIKKRADNKAMLVLLDNENNLSKYVTDVPEMAYTLMEISEKPVTIIYEGAYNLAPELMDEDNSVGIRISQELFSKELCKRFRKPIVSTSANVSGEPSASTFKGISKEIKESVDYIVKYRQDDNEKHIASSVIKLSKDGTIKILRP